MSDYNLYFLLNLKLIDIYCDTQYEVEYTCVVLKDFVENFIWRNFNEILKLPPCQNNHVYIILAQTILILRYSFLIADIFISNFLSQSIYIYYLSSCRCHVSIITLVYSHNSRIPEWT